jgi:outer membrane protein assembly factor BamB
MADTSIELQTVGKPLRLWPGVVLAIAIVLLYITAPMAFPEVELPVGMFGALAGAVLILVWWLFFSRAPWLERLGAVVSMVIATLIAKQLAHPSVQGAGQGMIMYLLPIPVLMLGLVAWAGAARNRHGRVRYLALVAVIVLSLMPFLIVRTAGVTSFSSLGFELHWRWTPTPEELLLAQGSDDPQPPVPAAVAPAAPIAPAVPAPVEPVAPAEAATGATAAPASAPSDPEDLGRGKPVVSTAPDALAPVTPVSTRPHVSAPVWPGFRGPKRDSVVSGVLVDTDWSQAPPIELWRRPIGPGWSSFAVDGDLVYTQEQRGEDEIVSCYRVSTGEPVWRHRDPVRFYESNGGAGPRATPTLHRGRVYTMGATGLVNALDAATGARLWSRDAATDTGKAVPDWGVASSPLVIDDLVIVAVAGRLAAYDAGTGDQKWLGQPGGTGYSSPHLATIAGVPQVLLLRGSRTISVSPADGTLLWEHASGPPSTSIVQPAVYGDDTVLIATGDSMGGNGILRAAVGHGPGGWSVEERWTSRGLKPYFNDFVAHDGHVYGFDGSILSCIDLADGTRKWKGGRYGNGQLVLLPEQDLLLVLSEDGELALISATPDKFTEIARLPALEGKTWNHPVVVGDTLLIRNGAEMAAYRLPMAAR